MFDRWIIRADLFFYQTLSGLCFASLKPLHLFRVYLCSSQIYRAFHTPKVTANCTFRNTPATLIWFFIWKKDKDTPANLSSNGIDDAHMQSFDRVKLIFFWFTYHHGCQSGDPTDCSPLDFRLKYDVDVTGHFYSLLFLYLQIKIFYRQSWLTFQRCWPP